MAKRTKWLRKDRPTPKKAKEMLKHGKVKGKSLTSPQKRLFGRVIGQSRKPSAKA